jgi:hypothetical protein
MAAVDAHAPDHATAPVMFDGADADRFLVALHGPESVDHVAFLKACDTVYTDIYSAEPANTVFG